MRRFISTIMICLFIFTTVPVSALAESIDKTRGTMVSEKEKRVKDKLEDTSEDDIDKQEQPDEKKEWVTDIMADKYGEAGVLNTGATPEEIVHGNSAYYKALKKSGKLQENKNKKENTDNTEADTAIDEEQLSSITLEPELQSMVLQSTSTSAWYNTLVGPSTMNGVNEQKYSAWTNQQEVISPQTGDLTLKYNDITLPGRNGLDLSINRIYQSNQAVLGNRVFVNNSWSGSDYSTYYLNRYALGLGWSFGFPSVQIEQENGIKEIYYHTGNGDSYHVNMTSDTTDSNLENYYIKDAVFSDNDTAYSNGQVASKYSFTTADKTKRYFGEDGRLLGIVDRFNNAITLKHQEMPITNYAPNSDFEYAETMGIWSTGGSSYYSYDSTFGKDDQTSIKFNSSNHITQSMLSKYIEVLPNTKYYLGGFINNQLTSGEVKLTYQEYTSTYGFIKRGTLVTSSQKNVWEQLSQEFTTSSNAKYIRIEIYNNNASGSSWVDKIRFDRMWPLISEITDSIGRKITFSYNNNLYEDNQGLGDVVITINDPGQTKSHTLTYQRSRWYITYNSDVYNASNNWQEERRYFALWRFSNGVKSQNYIYNDLGNTQEYFSFSYKTKNERCAYMPSALISDVELRNSIVHYDYEKTTKHLGTNGFYETHRVSARYEQYDATSGYTGNEYSQSYTYSGTYGSNTFDNETGYPSYYFDNTTNLNEEYTCKITQQNNLEISTTLKNSRDNKRVVKDMSTGETQTTYYDAYHPTFKDAVTQMRKATMVPNKGTNTLYIDYAYNDWGGLASETLPLTPQQRNDSVTKGKYTITYSYDPTYKFLKTKSYYQDISKPQLTETTNYDGQGRIESTVNAKGYMTEYKYEDAGYPGNVTKTIVNDINNNGDGKAAITTFDYSNGYHAFPTVLTRYYTENGIQKTSITRNTYEFIWGNILNTIDARNNTTSYEYDNYGRPVKITYPSTLGKDGEYIVEDNYSYSNTVSLSEYNNRYLFRVYNYRKKFLLGNLQVLS